MFADGELLLSRPCWFDHHRQLQMSVYRVTWEDPVSGECVDQYKLSDDEQEILQTSTYTRNSNGQKVVFRTMWKRA